MKLKKLLLLPAIAFSTSILSGCALIPTVTWVNWDGSVLEIDKNVSFGSVPTYDGKKPSRPSTPEFDYEFKGWDKEVSKAWLLHIEYKAEFKEIKRSYKVTWLETEFGTLKEEMVLYGSMPEPWSPPFPSSAEYNYEFTGWDKEIVPVTGEATYSTTFKKSIRSYEIKFVDYDGTVLKSETLNYNEMPTAPAVNPTREPSDDTVYTFTGWDKEIAKVAGNATYKAVYSTRPRENLNIQYNIDGLPQDSGVYPDSVLEFASFTLPAYTVDDYFDVEWYLDPEFKQESLIKNNELESVTTNLLVYGKRVSEHKFKIEYELGEGGFLPEGHKYPETIAHSENLNLNSCCEDILYAPRLANHMFDKWLDKDNKEITIISNVTSDLVLKAVYKVETFTIYFDFPTLNNVSLKVAYNSEDYLVELNKEMYAVALDGFTFKGWSFDHEKRSVASGPYLYDCDMTLFPIFEPISIA